MNTESRRHMRRMLNRQNLDRIASVARASNIEDWADIPPSFLTVDLTWNCNYDCRGCIDTMARDGQAVVRKRQGGNPTDPDPVHCEGPYLCQDAVESIVQFVKKYDLHGVQLMGGETLLHPHIDSFLLILAENTIPAELVSNGSLVPRHLDSLKRMLEVDGSWLRVSINGWDRYGERVGWSERGDELRDKVIMGLKQLISVLPDDKKDRIAVSTVAFKDALEDLEKIAETLADIGIRRMTVIRERAPQSKEFIPGQEHVRDVALQKVRELRGRECFSRLQISIADNILVDPIPQVKDYQPCPATILKTLLGADGYLYACTDHRGCKYARLVNLEDYDYDLEAAWRSEERVRAALSYCPSHSCKTIVCQRFEGNTAISMLRAAHHIWTF